MERVIRVKEMVENASIIGPSSEGYQIKRIPLPSKLIQGLR